MDKKTMCNDILSDTKASLSSYQTAICESNNMQLRQAFQQIRNDNESFQFELYKIASSKGYYKPAAPADMSEIQTLCNELKNC